MKKLRIILILILFSQNIFANSIFMKPQPMPKQGPWFEGWYYRFTDVQQKRSFTVLVSRSAMPGVILNGHNQPLPAHVSFLIKPADHAVTESYDYFPNSAVVEENQSGFVWRADGYGTLSDKKINLHLPNGDQIIVNIGQRLPWSKSNDSWGPNGLTGFLRLMPLHWWVESRGSPSSYYIKRANGDIYQGQAFGHLEKNWGKAFPSSWVWLQATSDDNKSHIVLAGGPLKFGIATLTTFLVGYKSSQFDAEFRPDQMLDTRYEKEFDPKNGSLILRCHNSEFYMRVEAKADPRTFAYVTIPTDAGYMQNGGIESFSATVHVDLWRNGSHLESQVFQGAALEFGGNYMFSK